MMGETYGKPHRITDLDNRAIKLAFHSTEERDAYMELLQYSPKNNRTSHAPSPKPRDRLTMPLTMGVNMVGDEATITITGYVTYRSEGWVVRFDGQTTSAYQMDMEPRSKLTNAAAWISRVSDMEEEAAMWMLTNMQTALLDLHPMWYAANQS